MSHMPQMPDDMTDEVLVWYYRRGDQNVGPVSTRELRFLVTSRTLGPNTLVWQVGMTEWAPARWMDELTGGPVDRRTMKIVQNASSNALGLFVLAIIELVMLAIVSLGGGSAMPCLLMLSVPLAIVAAIYLPLRAAALREINSTRRTLGWIGGVGLIGIAVVAVLMTTLDLVEY
jgi:small-conductance mechanosensitive channel